MRALLLIVLVVLLASTAFAADYHVRPTGDDSHDGLTPAAAWRSIDRVNAADLQPGDRVLFERGGIYRGQLRPHSGIEGKPIVYGAFGEGDKPALLGAVAADDESDWLSAGPNVWKTAAKLPIDVGNIIFNHGEAWGVKRWKRADLAADLDYFHDGGEGATYLYSTEHPARRFGSVELALRRHIIDQSNRHDIVYENLALRYGGAHGIGGGRVHRIIVRDCDISWIGGGDQYADERTVRFGNGVEFWGEARDCLVERCRIWQVYDAAVTNQNLGTVVTQADIIYRHNVIWDCEFSFEYWNRPAESQTRRIIFEHNTCIRAGGGWGHTQRPDPAGRHLCFYSNSAQTRGLLIRRNIFFEATEHAFDAPWWDPAALADRQVLALDENCWWQPQGQMIRFKARRYTAGEFAAYQADTGQEAHSIVADPKFADADALDFRLRPDSPCPQWGAAHEREGRARN